MDDDQVKLFAIALINLSLVTGYLIRIGGDELVAELHHMAGEETLGSSGPDPQPPEPTAQAEAAHALLVTFNLWDVERIRRHAR